MNNQLRAEASSFRDSAGKVFYWNNTVVRRVNKSYKMDYDLLMQSGLYDSLVSNKLLIPHEEIRDWKSFNIGNDEDIYLLLRPKKIDFISYPYEWSFSQLKDAALCTLKILKISIEHKLILKDCSAFNIQFNNGAAIFIDTLSFESYKEGQPWQGYKQFCQHFLAPLSLMAKVDIRLGETFKIFLDGIPLDFASKILGYKSYLSLTLLTHIHLHSFFQQKHSNDYSGSSKKINVSTNALMGLIDNLYNYMSALKLKNISTEWGSYYSNTNYTADAFKFKTEIVEEMLKKSSGETLWDIGANEGHFSRIGLALRLKVLAFDKDPIAVEKNYLQVKEKNEFLLPLCCDLTNPTPSLGWRNLERQGLIERGPADIVLALAVIHHLAISNNVPIEELAIFFHKICITLIIEFIPKSDSQVMRLLSSREDIFVNYNEVYFEKVFSQYFEILDKKLLNGSNRTLYHLKARQGVL